MLTSRDVSLSGLDKHRNRSRDRDFCLPEDDEDETSPPRKKTTIEEQWDRNQGFELTSVEQETYEKYFYGTEHWNYFTNDEDLGPVILSIKQETINGRDQFRWVSGRSHFQPGKNIRRMRIRGAKKKISIYRPNKHNQGCLCELNLDPHSIFIALKRVKSSEMRRTGWGWGRVVFVFTVAFPNDVTLSFTSHYLAKTARVLSP